MICDEEPSLFISLYPIVGRGSNIVLEGGLIIGSGKQAG